MHLINLQKKQLQSPSLHSALCFLCVQVTLRNLICMPSHAPNAFACIFMTQRRHTSLDHKVAAALKDSARRAQVVRLHLFAANKLPCARRTLNLYDVTLENAHTHTHTTQKQPLRLMFHCRRPPRGSPAFALVRIQSVGRTRRDMNTISTHLHHQLSAGARGCCWCGSCVYLLLPRGAQFNVWLPTVEKRCRCSCVWVMCICSCVTLNYASWEIKCGIWKNQLAFILGLGGEGTNPKNVYKNMLWVL